jgi:biopolymer transport protein ExbD
MELKMTSLIDVVFLLLIFFVWTASFRMVEYTLPSQVSEATPAGSAATSSLPPTPEADFPEIVVRILWLNRQPTWQLNGDPVATLSDVQSKLGTVFAIHRQAPVIVHPDQEVPLGHVIDVYDLIRRVGFDKVQFAASMEK